MNAGAGERSGLPARNHACPFIGCHVLYLILVARLSISFLPRYLLEFEETGVWLISWLHATSNQTAYTHDTCYDVPASFLAFPNLSGINPAGLRQAPIISSFRRVSGRRCISSLCVCGSFGYPGAVNACLRGFARNSRSEIRAGTSCPAVCVSVVHAFPWCALRWCVVRLDSLPV